MPSTAMPLASGFLTGSILTLVLPIFTVIVIVAWYVFMWRGGMGER
jgi:hypothetical protein